MRRRWSCRYPTTACSPDRRLLDDPPRRVDVVGQPEMPIERRRPRARALGPLDQDDRALAHHVVEPQVTRLVRVTQAIAVDVVDGRRPRSGGGGGVIMMNERIRGTGRARTRAQ